LLLRKILAGVARAGERFGKRKIAAMLVGADDLPPALSGLSTTGLLRGAAPTRIERWIDAACGADLLSMSTDEYRTLRLTPLGRDVMSGRVTDVAITPPIAAREKSSRRRRQRADRTRREPSGGESIAAADPAIADALRAWRLDEARRRGIAPFIVLHDRTLLAIAAARPRDTNALQDIPGIGPAKLAEYGDAIVSVVNSK
jgi:ATP-dependent DNA helicase RecQ